MNVAKTAAEMLDESVSVGQSARRVASDTDATSLRAALRRLARVRQVRIRTAAIDDSVAVVLTDAALWNEDAATMRDKLTPPR